MIESGQKIYDTRMHEEYTLFQVSIDEFQAIQTEKHYRLWKFPQSPEEIQKRLDEGRIVFR